MIYPDDYLKRVVEDASIENACWVKGRQEYEQNLMDAREDLGLFIDKKILLALKNTEIYQSVFKDFINNCLEMITTNWSNCDEYHSHILYVHKFINTFKRTRPKKIHKNIMTDDSPPFGSKLPLDIQNRILHFKNNIIDMELKNNIVDNIIYPLLKYLEQKRTWAYESQMRWE